MKILNEPHAKRTGCLKNGNPSGDPSNSPRCGAKTRKDTACLAPAMKNGRCRMHGGRSTGPQTIEGKKKSSLANFKSGDFTKESLEKRKSVRQFLQGCRKLIRRLEEARYKR